MPRFIILKILILGLLLTTGSVQAEEKWWEHDKEGSWDHHNWPMYGRNLSHSFSNTSSRINQANVAHLRPLWEFVTSDTISASPTVVNGILYVGSWDGFFYALNATSGALVWKFRVDCDNVIVPVPPHCLLPGQSPPPRFFSLGGLITSTAAVVEGKVYFAAGKTVYKLNARTGSLLWKHVICGNPENTDCTSDAKDPTQIFSSPAVFGDLVFIGHTAGADGYRGAIEALSVVDGSERWRFEVDPKLNAKGEPILDRRGRAIGGVNRGCGAVWSSAALDPNLGLVFFGTGDCERNPTPPYHDSILALDAKTGRLAWAYQPPRLPNGCDQDFGASPNLIDLHGRRYIGEGGKDGTYYLLTRENGNLAWSRNVVFGGSIGGIFGASFAGGRIFAATSLGDGIDNPTGRCDPSNPNDIPIQEPSIHSFAIDNGDVLWQRMHNHSVAPTSVANGVVFSGLIGIEGFGLNAYDVETGTLLTRLPLNASVNSAATPLGNKLFVTAGNSTDGSGSGVFAFTLP